MITELCYMEYRCQSLHLGQQVQREQTDLRSVILLPDQAVFLEFCLIENIEEVANFTI